MITKREKRVIPPHTHQTTTSPWFQVHPQSRWLEAKGSLAEGAAGGAQGVPRGLSSDRDSSGQEFAETALNFKTPCCRPAPPGNKICPALFPARLTLVRSEHRGQARDSGAL